MSYEPERYPGSVTCLTSRGREPGAWEDLADGGVVHVALSDVHGRVFKSGMQSTAAAVLRMWLP